MLQDMLKVAIEAAEAGGRVVYSNLGKNITHTIKPDSSPVSELDTKSEAKIVEIIQKAFPHHKIVSEEIGEIGRGDVVWYVDPLDGSNNFKEGMDIGCVSIGVWDGKQFVTGVVYDFMHDKLYGADHGRTELTVSTSSLSEGLVGMSHTLGGFNSKGKVDMYRLLAKEFGSKLSLRSLGSTALELAYVAKGTFVANISDMVSTHDFAAGVALIESAGGIVTDQYGNPATPNTKFILAANSLETHESLVTLTREAYAGYLEE